jgi:4-amino-4-deoxy-L-arabinose transferase-like glycosyltransferase
MKKFKNKSFLFLLVILILAAFLRFWQLGKVPPSPDWDEAALGYNAYSILKTGKDEYGKFLPLILRSFDDYKPAIYVYLIIPAIKIFGLNTFAVRLPAAIIGTLAVLLIYYLVNELFINELQAKNKLSNSLSRNKLIALTASFLLAISPWHLQFSRIAFETQVGLFFDVLIAFLILKSFQKPALLLLAAFFAGLNIYVYQAEKIFTPLLLLVFLIIWRKKIFSLPKKYLFLAIIIGWVLIIPFGYLTLTTPEIFLRAKGTSVAADQTPFLARTVEKLIRDKENNDLLGLILDNRRVVYFKTFIAGWLSHFDLNWLFLTGDEARHHAPGMGLMYLWELPFLLLGIYELIFGNYPRSTKVFLFSWLAIAPIPASFTTGVPHAVRTIRMLPIPQILVALGIIAAVEFLQKKPKTWRFLACGLGVIFFIFNFAYYFNQYFVQQNYFYSSFWQYGYQQAIEEIQKIEKNYQKIVVSNQPHLDQSYMFFLFYLKYDPKKYQEAGGTISGGFAESHKGFEKYTFRPIKWEEEERSEKILYVGRPQDFPQGVKLIKTIYFLNGEPAICLVEGG